MPMIDKLSMAHKIEQPTGGRVSADQVMVSNAVGDKSADRRSMDELLNKSADLLGGTDAMRAAGLRWLPRWPAERTEDYKERMKLTFLFGGYEEGVKTLSGKPFKVPIVIEGHDKSLLSQISRNFDGEGSDINGFFSRIIFAGLADGLTHVMVDMPDRPIEEGDPSIIKRNDGKMLVTSDRASTILPYCTHIPHRNVLGWDTAVIAGRRHLTMLRVEEDSVESVNGEEQLVERVRVYYPGRFELWRRIDDTTPSQKGTYKTKSVGRGYGQIRSYTVDWPQDGRKFFLEGRADTGLDRIPIHTLYTDEDHGVMIARSPLDGLADLNLEHWIFSSDYRWTVHNALVSILVITGAREDEVQGKSIAPNSRIILADPSAKVYRVAIESGTIEAGEKMLTRIEDHMRISGMSMLIKKQMTATERRLDAQDEMSDLRRIAVSLENMISSILGDMHEWVGKPLSSPIKVNLFRDFELESGSDKELEILSQSRARGDLTRSTYLKELKRRNILNDDVDIDAEVKATDGEEQSKLDGLVNRLQVQQ